MRNEFKRMSDKSLAYEERKLARALRANNDTENENEAAEDDWYWEINKRLINLMFKELV